ncbi:MAG: LysR substrate-binding domain-containing protein [Cyclobacteriaceae bacterium]
MKITLTQLEYLIAVDTYRHFSTAAEKCFVSQPTLSMQIQKAEEDLGVKVFDRSKQPVVPTEIGEKLLAQARKIIHESVTLQEIVAQETNALNGELKMAIIPTVAPYLIPLFLQKFFEKQPGIHLTLNEWTTDVIVEQLKRGQIDVGILVTPLHDVSIKEDPLFYEEFVVYASKSNALHKKNFVLADDIDVKKLWLLQEGHCFRSQILNLCELRQATREEKPYQYEAGSIDTLRKMVEIDQGVTILPELATLDLTVKQKALIHHFRAPAPVREVSIVTHRNFVKRRLIDALKAEILSIIPPAMIRPKNKKVIDI